MDDREISSAILRFYGGHESRWTQDAWARDKRGRTQFAESDVAVCWCLDGASDRAGVSETDWTMFCEKHFGSIGAAMTWNDAPWRTFADVERKLREIAGGQL